jgi:hypothetical protein
VYYFFRYRMEITRVAEAILVDEGNGSIDPVERMIVENRLFEHITGKKPIKGDEWLKSELKKEKKRRKKVSQ